MSTIFLYQKEKLRQSYLEEPFYYAQMVRLNQFIELGLKNAIEDKEGDYSIVCYDFYHKLVMQYTVGGDIASLEPILEEMMTWAQCFKDRYECMEDKGDYTQRIFMSTEETERLPNILGLSILFNRPDLMANIRNCLYENMNNDPAIDSLIHSMLPEHPITELRFPHYFGFRRDLLKALNAKTKASTLKHLNHYLSKWYDALRPMYGKIADKHLEQDPSRGGYFGYWAFEAAAVAYLKGIDDTELHEFIYYPKDIVQYAREKYPLRFNQDGTVEFGCRVIDAEAVSQQNNQ